MEKRMDLENLTYAEKLIAIDEKYRLRLESLRAKNKILEAHNKGSKKRNRKLRRALMLSADKLAGYGCPRKPGIDLWKTCSNGKIIDIYYLFNGDDPHKRMSHCKAFHELNRPIKRRKNCWFLYLMNVKEVKNIKEALKEMR
jgi:hypothetical protein